MTTIASSRPGFFAVGERTDGIIATLRRTLAEYLDYRRTLAQLRALSIRQRDDLGIAGLDMQDVARAATRTN